MAVNPSRSQRMPAAPAVTRKTDEPKPLTEEERRARVRAAIRESADKNAELLRRLAK